MTAPVSLNNVSLDNTFDTACLLLGDETGVANQAQLLFGRAMMGARG